jgi:hypothetical protein
MEFVNELLRHAKQFIYQGVCWYMYNKQVLLNKLQNYMKLNFINIFLERWKLCPVHKSTWTQYFVSV